MKVPTASWLTALRTYILISLNVHLAWENSQLPLHTIWSNERPGRTAFAVVHCTGGEGFIAIAALSKAW